ncbi:MAG: transglutaminase-like domain-containing protein [Pseudomonadota bacterium]
MLAFLVLGGLALLGSSDTRTLHPIDPAALSAGPGQDRWMGIFFEDQPVGYAVSSQIPTLEGGMLLRSRSVFRLVAMGRIQRVLTAGTAVMDTDSLLQRFEFFMDSDQLELSVRGEVRPGLLHMEVLQAGEVQTLELPMARPPQLSLSLERALIRDDMAVGQRFSIPYFDPVTLAQADLEVEVTDVTILPGTAEEAYWLTTTFAGVQSRRLVTPSGETLREESGLGLSLVRMTRDEAEALLDRAEPVDLIARAAVRLGRPLPDARAKRLVKLTVSGIDPALIPDQPPLQRVEGAEVTVEVPIAAEIPALPRYLAGTVWEENGSPLLRDAAPLPPADDPTLLAALRPGPLLPSDHPEVRARALEIVQDIPDRKAAAAAIERWVYAHVQKRPLLSLPNGLEVLRRLEGDCNEYTALYVTLARAAGVPARIAAGLVYSEEVDGSPAFWYHAWPEVHLGGEHPWVPVDPTFGQFPADATHLKLAEGDLDRQVEILGLMGQIGLTVTEAR